MTVSMKFGGGRGKERKRDISFVNLGGAVIGDSNSNRVKKGEGENFGGKWLLSV